MTDEYDGRRAVPITFFMLLESYQNHPEAKSLGPDGRPCELDTHGLLQRAHIIANWPPIYIGKEHDRHREHGEDLSLLGFNATTYKRKGYAIATDEQVAQIAKVPKRELMRRGINQHTVEVSNMNEIGETVGMSYDPKSGILFATDGRLNEIAAFKTNADLLLSELFRLE